MARSIFSWFPPAASFFPFRALSLSCTGIKMALHWAWAECNFTGKYSRGKSYHGMWVADNTHVKCIEVFQFKCICLSLGLSVECEPHSDCQHYPVDAGKELAPSAGWWASAASQECHDLITHGCNEWEDRPVVITLSPHQQCYSGISWGVGGGLVLEQTLKYHMITQYQYSVQRPGYSLSLWFVEIEQRTTVQSQFMLKSSTQIMFKQMQTKFVGKPLLHFPPNLIKTLKLIKTIVRFLEYEKRYFISNFNQMLK